MALVPPAETIPQTGLQETPDCVKVQVAPSFWLSFCIDAINSAVCETSTEAEGGVTDTTTDSAVAPVEAEPQAAMLTSNPQISSKPTAGMRLLSCDMG